MNTLRHMSELLLLLWIHPNGMSWSELQEKQKVLRRVNGTVQLQEIHIPRATLARYLKLLMDEGLVTRIEIRTGKKGRPAGFYKLVCTPPILAFVKRLGNRWFYGAGKIVEMDDLKTVVEQNKENGRKKIVKKKKRVVQKIVVRLSGSEKVAYDKMKKITT